MPLPMVALGVNGIQTTPLGFGCASIFRVSSPAQRSGLLHTAYDCGLRHFDVAPMYGLGRAEHELGTFARPRRAELTIATKFGIKPKLTARGLSWAQRPARRLFAARPGIRDQARALAAVPGRRLYAHGGFDAAGARRSLERSLRALRTDYIDLFLLHDPVPGTVRSDDVSACLEKARAQGLIRSWGIAGDLEPTDEVARSFHERVAVRQLRDDIFVRSLQSRPAGVAFVTFGVIAQALTRLVRYISADDARRRRWERTVGADCGDPEVATSFLLLAALRENASGVVLFSSTRPSHIRGVMPVLEAASHSLEVPALDAFLHMVDAELRPIPETARESS
jgi:D-threo-aldose 1-dehydrogenase